MREILKDCSDPNIVMAMETNWCNVIAQWGQSSRAHVKKSPDHLAVVSSIPFGSLNSVCLAQLTPENVDEKITEIIGYYKSHGVPFRWFVGPSTKPPDIAKHLEQHGFKHSWTRPCMAVELNQLEADVPKPDNFAVEPVKDVEAMSEWAHVLRLGDEGSDSSERNWYTFEVDLGFSETLGRYRYLGYLNGEPVATSLMYIDSGVAGISRARLREDDIIIFK